mmetsp:Transcript_65880/g.190017  ORF Transcript_65880/g.190017 Transcript_65880/m.190017 type:complete len:222 (-) Transcript_65880:17-682(-)
MPQHQHVEVRRGVGQAAKERGEPHLRVLVLVTLADLDETTERPQQPQRCWDRLATQRVQDNVHALPAGGLAQALLEGGHVPGVEDGRDTQRGEQVALLLRDALRAATQPRQHVEHALSEFWRRRRGRGRRGRSACRSSWASAFRRRLARRRTRPACHCLPSWGGRPTGQGPGSSRPTGPGLGSSRRTGPGRGSSRPCPCRGGRPSAAARPLRVLGPNRGLP